MSNTLAVKVDLDTSADPAATDDVHVLADGTGAALHVASAVAVSDDPRNSDTVGRLVTGLKTLCVGVNEDEAIIDC